jgi:hypothetical protein
MFAERVQAHRNGASVGPENLPPLKANFAAQSVPLRVAPEKDSKGTVHIHEVLLVPLHPISGWYTDFERWRGSQDRPLAPGELP